MGIEDFMQKLSAQTASASMSRTEFKERPRNLIEKIPLSFAGNFGRYQVCPINSKITDFPFVALPDTREISIPRKFVQEDGKEIIKNMFVRILPVEAYRRKENGMEFSGLTNEDSQLLTRVQGLWDELERELDLRNNPNALEIQKNLLRKKSYTIFYAYCLRKWNLENSRQTSRENFLGLFYSTSKTFLPTIEDNMKEEITLSNGDTGWYDDCYCADLRQRRGVLIFTIGPRPDNRPGYQISAQHKYGQPLNLNLTDEDLAPYNNPVLTFLGWQALKEDKPDVERKLFNAELHEEAGRFISQQLAAVRAAKANQQDIMEAIKQTNELASSSAPTLGGPRTNDPMLKNDQPQSYATPANPERIVEQNTDPYASAPAAHFNPGGNVASGQNQFSGGFQPQSNPTPQAAPFQKPTFAGGFSGGNNNGKGFPF